MKTITIILLALILTACDVAPPIESKTNEQGVTTELIAIVDGCRVWRIDRGGMSNPMYMTRCPEGTSDTQWRQQSGKSSYTVQNMGGN